MKPTDELKEEHRGVEVMLRIIDRLCGRMTAGQAVPVQHLEQILEFLKVFVDTCHHGKEEEQLFPAMEAAGVPREGGPIGQMLFEHEQGRAFVRAMSAAAREYAGGAASGGVAFAAQARDYIGLLTGHIGKEDNVLYPLADQLLSPETQAGLSAAFARIEEERVGHGRHDAFHAMMHRLAEEYAA
ncbi:MAG TPA: hemerythrin domain-containing protein [Candidatus Deferrimicrobiaceae bacterium]|jgi:hemerythrin-like domain-containing protein